MNAHLLRAGCSELDAGELFQMGSGRGSCLPCGAWQGQVDWGQVEGSWRLRSCRSPQGEGGGAGCLWLPHLHFLCVSCCEDRKEGGPSAAQTARLHSIFGQLVWGLRVREQWGQGLSLSVHLREASKGTGCQSGRRARCLQVYPQSQEVRAEVSHPLTVLNMSQPCFH